MVPIIELRGAIPIGLGMGLPVLPTYLLCVLGNMIPVPFIYLFARKFLIWGYHKPLIGPICRFCGKLNDAVTIGAYLDASTEVGRKVERLYCYASQRHDEDTRDDKAQSMYARVGSKYVKMAAALSFAQPEILSLPEETLTAIVNDPAVADYKFVARIRSASTFLPRASPSSNASAASGFG